MCKFTGPQHQCSAGTPRGLVAQRKGAPLAHVGPRTRPGPQLLRAVQGPVDLRDDPQGRVDLSVAGRHDTHHHDEPARGTAGVYTGDDAILEETPPERLMKGGFAASAEGPCGIPLQHFKLHPCIPNCLQWSPNLP